MVGQKRPHRRRCSRWGRGAGHNTGNRKDQRRAWSWAWSPTPARYRAGLPNARQASVTANASCQFPQPRDVDILQIAHQGIIYVE
jgi:hypothetical protein